MTPLRAALIGAVIAAVVCAVLQAIGCPMWLAVFAGVVLAVGVMC